MTGTSRDPAEEPMFDGGVSARAVSLESSGSVRRAPILALLTANCISQSGSMLTFIAIPWFVLVTTGSAAQTGLVAAVGAIGHSLALFFGGTLVDRLGFKRMSVLADLLALAAIGAIPLLFETVGLAFWQLLALTFLANVFDAPGWTARGSLLPDLAGLAQMPLERANSINQAAQGISQLLGPPLAGVLIALIGSGNVLWFDAASFGVSAIMVLALVPTQRVARATTAAGGYIAELLEGLRFLWRDRLLRAIIVIDVPLNALGTALGGILLPVYAQRQFNSSVALGVMLAAFGGGMLVGVVSYGVLGPRLPRRTMFVASLLLFSLPMLAFIISPPLLGCVALILAVGLVIGPINPMLSTVTQERVPSELRGRVFGANNGLGSVAGPVGALGAGLLLAFVSVQTLFAVIGVSVVLIGVAAALAPAFRLLNEPAPAFEAADEPARATVANVSQTPAALAAD
jgi:MFS family permease